MKKYVYLELGLLKTKFLGVEYAEPECGEHFCDACGDCLHCYGGDECLESSSGQHIWVEYRESRPTLRAADPISPEDAAELENMPLDPDEGKQGGG